MQQLAVVATLKTSAEPRAAELIAKGPPFDPEANGLDRHTVFLSAGEVVFVFEGPEVEWMVEQLVDDPLQPRAVDALEEWRPLVEGEPRIARPTYAWVREGMGTGR
jgi:hypothetical protein